MHVLDETASEFHLSLTGPTKKKWRSYREVDGGKSRQIPFRKKSLFLKITTDRIAEGIPENNGDHFEGEI